MSLHRELAPHEKRVTLEEARALVGKWFVTLGTNKPCILIRVGETNVLMRHAGNRRVRHSDHGYFWTGVDALLRREDMDRLPDPDWLQQALDSPRPSRELHDVIQARRNPEYTRYALEQRAARSEAESRLLEKVADEAAGAAIVDELTYRSYAHQRRTAPHRTPAEWARVFDHVEQLEARYQRELRDDMRESHDAQDLRTVPVFYLSWEQLSKGGAK